jgi:hydrogenase maturation protease
MEKVFSDSECFRRSALCAMRYALLVIGYGNTYCGDDGVGFYIANALRSRMGLRELQTDEDGLDDLGHGIDSIMLHQLVPEVAPVVSNYRTVVFVDAHLGTVPEDVRVIPVHEEYSFHAVTHHMSPGMLLATARKTNGAAPTGYVVSIRGERFDFGLGLTDGCKVRADLAIERILGLVEEMALKQA